MWSTCGWPGSGVGPSSQPSNRPPSSEHSYSAASVEEKMKAALVLVVEAFGPETTVVSGTPWSTVHVHSSGVWSTNPSGVDVRHVTVQVVADGAHAEEVVAQREARVLGRRLALAERLAVDRALEDHCGLV